MRFAAMVCAGALLVSALAPSPRAASAAQGTLPASAPSTPNPCGPAALPSAPVNLPSYTPDPKAPLVTSAVVQDAIRRGVIAQASMTPGPSPSTPSIDPNCNPASSAPIPLPSGSLGPVGPCLAQLIAASGSPSTAAKLLPYLYGEILGEGIRDPAVMAYIIATAEHETDSYRTLREYGAPPYFDKYESNTAKGQELGNTTPGDGHTYRGRGFVQVTGKSNYAKIGKMLGVDLINHPELLEQDPRLAARATVLGMMQGTFTGVGVTRYVGGSKFDWYNARRVVNGTDEAEKIAGYAQKYYNILLRCKP